MCSNPFKSWKSTVSLLIILTVTCTIYSVNLEASATNICGKLLSGMHSPISTALTIHPLVTYHRQFENLLPAFTRSRLGITGEIPPLNIENIINGEENLLSLGEGGGNFASTLIDRQKIFFNDSSRLVTNIHAADFRYVLPDVVPIGQNMQPDDETVKERLIYLTSNYPLNYHGALFQTMDIRDQNEKRIFFDEIVSSYSLSFVLGHTSFEETLQIFRRILSHLKPGGRLRISPTFFGEDVQEALDRLIDEGEIKNYTPARSSELGEEWLLTLVKNN